VIGRFGGHFWLYAFRHTENILINRCTGGTTQVDFDCLFGKSFELQFPEVC